MLANGDRAAGRSTTLIPGQDFGAVLHAAITSLAVRLFSGACLGFTVSQSCKSAKRWPLRHAASETNQLAS